MLCANIGTTGMNSHLLMVSYFEHNGLLFLTVGETARPHPRIASRYRQVQTVSARHLILAWHVIAD